MTKDMTEGNPLLLILKFALPLLAGNLLQQGYNVADAAIVGRFLGTNALAGVGASSSVQFLILGFCIEPALVSAYPWPSVLARETTVPCGGLCSTVLLSRR